MVAFIARMAERAKCWEERDADIVWGLRAGVSLAEMGNKYFFTRERVRQIGLQTKRQVERGKCLSYCHVFCPQLKPWRELVFTKKFTWLSSQPLADDANLVAQGSCYSAKTYYEVS